MQARRPQRIKRSLTQDVVEKVAVIVVGLKSLIQSWSTLMQKQHVFIHFTFGVNKMFVFTTSSYLR